MRKPIYKADTVLCALVEGEEKVSDVGEGPPSSQGAPSGNTLVLQTPWLCFGPGDISKGLRWSCSLWWSLWQPCGGQPDGATQEGFPVVHERGDRAHDCSGLQRQGAEA